MRREKARRHVWQMGQVIPCLLAVVFLMDISMRFIPVDPLTGRAWEALMRARPPGAAFEPNRHYYNARSYGDLAAFGNFPELRQYRPETFTTDALGFRNAAHILDGNVDAILAGDSFAAGAGVSDDETLPSRLSKLTGCIVYNAGSEAGRVVPDEILDVARRLNVRNRLVIRLYNEDAEMPAIPTSRSMLVRKLVAWTPVKARSLVGRLKGLLAVSPLQILSGRAWRTLADDRILPNKYAVNVVRETLNNGDTILFRASDVNNFYRRREVAHEYWRWLQGELQKTHFDLWVVLVPGKYTVYRPFLVNQRPVGQGGDGYLDRLERDLRAEGVPVLNLTPFLSAEAVRYLEHGEYLYWLDDIHWNARGIALATEEIQMNWPLTGGTCSTSRSPALQKLWDEPRISKERESRTTLRSVIGR